MDLQNVGARVGVVWNNVWSTAWKATFVLLVMAVVGLAGFRVLFVNWVDNYELGYMFDATDGTTTILPRTGYIVSWPFVNKVHHIDLRPMQVCISAIQRVLNCKLVKFNPSKEGVLLFLEWHGRQDYDGPDTSGGNRSPREATYTYLQSALLNYAYGWKPYPFLTVLEELKPESAEK